VKLLDNQSSPRGESSDSITLRVRRRESVVSRDAEMLKISVGVSTRPASLSIRVATADINLIQYDFSVAMARGNRMLFSR
jgi:hypothetical protein